MVKIVPWSAEPKLGDIAIAIISLDDAYIRRESLVRQGVKHEWVNGYWVATDMRREPYESLEKKQSFINMENIYDRKILPGEFGCMLSHNSVINWFAEKCEASLLIVLEDDVFPVKKNFLDELLEYASCLEKRSRHGEDFVCHLGLSEEQWSTSFSRKVNSKLLFEKKIDLYHHFNKREEMWMAHAYFISKKAAIQYSKASCCLNYLADDWRRISIASSFKLLSIGPGIFSQNDNLSSFIDPEKFRSNNKLMVVNYLSKGKIFLRKLLVKLVRVITDI